MSTRRCILGLTLLALVGCAGADAAEEPEGSSAAVVDGPRRYVDGPSCAEGWSAKDASALSGLAVGRGAPRLEAAASLVLRPFVSDGCSVSLDGIPMSSPVAWQACCVAHDVDYWLGGTAAEKAAADEELRHCIDAAGYPRIARLYKGVVDKMGGPETNQSYRWGYGWSGRRAFGPLTDDEIAQATALYDVPRSGLRSKLLDSDAPLVRTCDTVDPAFRKLTAEERTAYDHLRSTLDTPDRIEWARWGYFNLEERRLEVKLASCADPTVFTFSPDGKLVKTVTCGSGRSR